ncbi:MULTISPECIES: nuclear transport factor 2 family protein [Paraburkholderia]|uniref:nuclear transport factor 2 family protein n=1 Tax=Paraburkholderia TaxID=1822464 RepID=UPI002250EB98|nr:MULTISPECIES: nuclear transport factor 2 family protein [Paraburkholderia]MCX4177415.1 nuclear transport factor 2 family protein [Paraburkholderia madseniana]MDQ6465404.1 nuclear transport factor 2 family protein [Paraburkholderia madseniana]
MQNEESWRDIEEIKQLKAKYVRYGDTQQWEKFRELFTEDFVGVYEVIPRSSSEESNTATIEGLDKFVVGMAVLLKGARTVHQAFLPEITLTSPTTAEGIWAMHDWVQMPTSEFKGWGHYHERYVKVDGVWKIEYSRTTRLRTWEKFI